MICRIMLLVLCSLSLQASSFDYSRSHHQLKKDLIKELYQMGAIKIQDVALKNGSVSPIYFDMRMIISDTEALRLLAHLMEEKMVNRSFDLLCGVPYAAVPLTTAIALKSNCPMIMQRKEAKAYGTKKLIEGMFAPGNRCALVEDVVTTGGSILESVKGLEAEGLIVHDVFVVIDREQGGVAHIQQHGYRVHVLFTMSEILQALAGQGYITYEKAAEIKQFCASHRIAANTILTYDQRAALAHNRTAKKLFTIMHDKQSNLAVAADVTTKAALLALADAVGSEICFLKTHIDMIEDFDDELIEQLQSLARKHNFLIVEDRKFADIGSTVQHQYTGGTYHISQWADIVIAHAIAGPETIKALAEAAPNNECGLLLVAQLSSRNNMIDDTYTQRVVEMANLYDDFVVGFIAQEALNDNPFFIVCTPGIHGTLQQDVLNQRYNTPEYAISEQKSDIVIVGRAIYQTTQPSVVAHEYKNRAWHAYQERINKAA